MAEFGSPLQVVRTALDRGRRLGVDLEAYAESGRTVEIKVFGRQVESVSVAQPRGLGIRALRAGRVGYAFTADLSPSGIDRVLRQAVAAMAVVDADQWTGLPSAAGSGYPTIAGLWSPRLGSTSLEEKMRLALKAEEAALAAPEVETVEESAYSDEESRVAVASTAGIEAEAERSFCVVWVMAHAGRDGERQSGLGFCAGRHPESLDPVAAGAEAAAKARALLGARPCPTGRYTVVLDREVTGALLSYLAQALNAEAVQKGRSIFAGRLGEAVASSLVRLVDDGLAPQGMASNPFDGEGVPHQKTTLISEGVLQAYLHNTYTARKAGRDARSTGNAARASYRVTPRVGVTNLVLEAGRGSLNELVARVGDGLYVDSVSGLHSGVNVISGEISVGITGRLIEAGALSRPVREATIATDFNALLGSVTDLAADERWLPLYGSVCTPSIAVAGVAVSGT
jgi:PmbA protein